MKSVFIYCEVENHKVAEISQELLSTGKTLDQSFLPVISRKRKSLYPNLTSP